MAEEKSKNRGWVKNAAIIFLAVMLALTFFSNTILNHSLPEVAVQYVRSGEIMTSVRGTGTVEAAENYEVSLDQSRQVESALIRTGDEVKAGDVLFLLADTESEELAAARDTLADLQLQYQKALITDAAPDYAEDEREIAKTQQRLATAQREVAESYVGEDEIDEAKELVEKREDKVARLTAELMLIDAAEEPEEYRDCSADLQKAQSSLKKAQDELTELEEKQATYQAAVKNMESLEETLSDQQFALEQKQKENTTTQQINQLDLGAMQREIAEQQQKVAQLAASATGREVTAPVAGIIAAVNVTAGKTAVAGEPLATIEVPDMGYSLSFSVSAEQAKKVRVGDSATVGGAYWGPQIEAELTAVKNDPQQPGQNKLLVFTLHGDVTSGSQLTLSVGERSANYELVVPASALRSDSKGDFVLIVQARNTPLGSRYTARRANVTILAQDETNAAVTGVNSYDYVITTSNRPIEDGSQVRLAE